METTLSYHLPLFKMVIVKKTIDNKCCNGVEKREPLYTVGRNVNSFNHLENSMERFLKKLKIDLPYDPAILLLSMYPKEMKAGYRKYICTLIWQHNSQWPSCGNNLRVDQWMNG